MATTAEVTAEHYAAQQRQTAATLILTRRQWRQMSADDLKGSWAQIVSRLSLIVSAAQLGAARAGAAYVPEALGSDVQPDGQVNPKAWSGVASDGRALDSLLYSSVVRALTHIQAGDTPQQALVAGGKWLDALVSTQVADAGRGAAGVAITARPQVGYVRMVSPPCCQRCAVLAGKYFKWNQGFKRHPKCDCRHVPAEGGSIPEGFTSKISADQIKDLTEAQRKAIGDGADTNQVINSHRKGRRDGMTTSEGTTRRGRVTPEAVYRLSSSREEAISLLRKHGYII